jgi:hypothetical protein
MFFDGAGIRLQSIRDLSVGLALRQSGKDSALAGGERR